MRRVFQALSALSLALWPQLASADDGEWVLSLEPSYRLLRSADETNHGAGGLVSAWLGLNETAWLVASAGGSYFPSPGTEVLEASGGLVLALDVLQVIPFLEGSLGAETLDGRLSPFFRLGVGADYLLSPDWSIGGILRYRPLFDAPEAPGVQLSARLSWRGEL